MPVSMINDFIDLSITLDEVFQTMHTMGYHLPRQWRCTTLGGLSITPTPKDIELHLKHKG